MTATGDDKAARKHDAMQRISRVQGILRRWDPIGGRLVPADQYDSYAPHIVSMVAQGCSIDQLCSQLESIRFEMGVGPLTEGDRAIAAEILRALSDSTGPT